ncbi:hypothetical protein KR222_005724, partial [Zaprionus bogoriensis]
MDVNQIQALIAAAVSQALAQQEASFQIRINEMQSQISSLRIETPQVEAYKRIEIHPEIMCDIPLDIVKSIPDFNGTQDEYVAWRQSATDAYELFRPFNGSSAHYQAVSIMRNKLKGPARAILVSHNTVLNFDAIIARLDCTYADRTSLRLLRQGLDMVRQTGLSLMEYYDEVEQKLTLVTNKITMTHDREGAELLNKEIRSDALHAFISGLNKPLKAIVFPAQPKDLPSALALAREAEASIERSIFANTYARAVEERAQASEANKHRAQFKQGRKGKDERGQEKNPHFVKRRPNSNGQEQSRKEDQDQPPVEPMEIDSSSKFRQAIQFVKNQANNAQAQKRNNT